MLVALRTIFGDEKFLPAAPILARLHIIEEVTMESLRTMPSLGACETAANPGHLAGAAAVVPVD